MPLATLSARFQTIFPDDGCTEAGVQWRFH